MTKEPVRILLMEDDAGSARLCRRALERAGYVVDHACDGQQGLALYDAGAYDVLTLDHAMPVYDGLEVIRRLASRGFLPPIVMVTGAGDERTAVEAMKLGAYDYVVKDADGGYLDLLPPAIERALQRHRVEERVRLAAQVFESAAEGIMVADAQGQIVSVNPAFTSITGYTAEEVVGKNPRVLQSGRHDKDFYKAMWATLVKTGRWHGEIWDRRKNGAAYPAWVTINAVKDERGRTSHYASTFTDITVHKQTEERLGFLATHDPLTGLANRALFGDRLTQAVAFARREKRTAAVMLLDLDRFKPVNDTLGHPIGDLVLQEVAKRLLGCVRDCDTAARLGGDEFGVLLSTLSCSHDAVLVAQRVLQAIAQPFIFGARECAVTASIGVSLYPAHGEKAEALLANADSAMYRAKKRRNCYELSRPNSEVKSS